MDRRRLVYEEKVPIPVEAWTSYIAATWTPIIDRDPAVFVPAQDSSFPALKAKFEELRTTGRFIDPRYPIDLQDYVTPHIERAVMMALTLPSDYFHGITRDSVLDHLRLHDVHESGKQDQTVLQLAMRTPEEILADTAREQDEMKAFFSFAPKLYGYWNRFQLAEAFMHGRIPFRRAISIPASAAKILDTTEGCMTFHWRVISWLLQMENPPQKHFPDAALVYTPNTMALYRSQLALTNWPQAETLSNMTLAVEAVIMDWWRTVPIEKQPETLRQQLALP